MKFVIHLDDLQTVLNLLKRTNANYVTLDIDNSSGIGSIIKASVPMDLNGLKGEFTQVITDENDW